MTRIATSTCLATATARIPGMTPKVQTQVVAATVTVVHESCFNRSRIRSGPRSSTATYVGQVGGDCAFMHPVPTVPYSMLVVMSQLRKLECTEPATTQKKPKRLVYSALPQSFCITSRHHSGIRESNPSHSLGKAGHSRYTNPALVIHLIPTALAVQGSNSFALNPTTFPRFDLP